jgi:hypothetical protein
MKRWAMRILSMSSLVLLAGSVVLWVRSVRVNDQLSYRNDRTVFTLMSAPHRLCFERTDVPRAGMVAIMASSVILPEPGWSVRSLPWGQYVATSHAGTSNSGSQTMFSIRFTISMNNNWVEPVNSALGFGWETQPRPLVVVVPFWFLVILFSILPIVWIRRAIRDRARRAHGLCAQCGYDLRATPGRCPECGRHAPHVARDVHSTATEVESVHH